ncbi:MAG: dienelactone hydrolase-like protein [Chitinophagaceae bacterium]|nr:dienelactone hydrolase-like protein [Chitinophagaceae bacterium]
MNLTFCRLLIIINSLFVLQACVTTKKVAASADSYFITGDTLPDAPKLAARGEYKVGVRTIELVNKNQVDILHSKAGADPLYDRHLKVEIWYPALIPEGKKELVAYNQVMGMFNDSARPLVPFTFEGRALRDAAPDGGGGTYPLIIVSHGYPGTRLILTYLTENLASKGYVVAAIDHTESTFFDRAGFQSTLLNRAKDILFVLNQVADLSKVDSKSFLAGLADANNTGLIGYSMGGYGVLNAAGAGYSPKLDSFFTLITGGSKAINVRLAGNANYKATFDTRVKAVVAFAPWGMQRGVWNAEGLQGLKIPTFFVAGNQDDVSGYEEGIKAIYQGVVNARRYLLTYENARHNIAPNPPPPETLKPAVPYSEYSFYAEPSWKEQRINNINQHFITAFLGIYLKKMDYSKYLELQEKSNDKTWTGFKPRTSVGLELLQDSPR